MLHKLRRAMVRPGHDLLAGRIEQWLSPRGHFQGFWKVKGIHTYFQIYPSDKSSARVPHMCTPHLRRSAKEGDCAI